MSFWWSFQAFSSSFRLSNTVSFVISLFVTKPIEDSTNWAKMVTIFTFLSRVWSACLCFLLNVRVLVCLLCRNLDPKSLCTHLFILLLLLLLLLLFRKCIWFKDFAMLLLLNFHLTNYLWWILRAQHHSFDNEAIFLTEIKTMICNHIVYQFFKFN